MSAPWAVLAALAWTASFLFSGLETGIYALNKERLRLRSARGDPRAGRLHALLGDPEGLISTLLAGNHLALFILSALATVWMVRAGVAQPELWSLVTVAPVLFWTAEILPKELFRRHAEILTYAAAGFLALSRRVLAPLVWIMKEAGLLFTRALGPRDESLTRRRLGYLFLEGVQDGVMSPYENRLVRNILELGSRRVGDVRVPLSRAVGVPASASAAEVVAMARSEWHSRLLVLGVNPGEVLGAVHVMDAQLASVREATAGSLSRPLPHLPAWMPVQQALSALRRSGQSMALTEAEGKVEGLVTLKDLVEEVVGELWDW